MTEATKGELAVIKMRHSYVSLHAGSSESFTYEPVSVEHASLAGRVMKVKNAWGSPRKSTEWSALFVVRGSKASELLPQLEKEYDSFAEVRDAVRAAMSTAIRSEG